MASHRLAHTNSVLGKEFIDIKRKYTLLERIGQGTFGVVRKCRNIETGEICAVKSILKDKVPDLELLKKEVELLSEVDHPHIIKLYDVFEEEKTIHLVTELCSGGELYDRVVEKSHSPEHHFSEYDAARILRNILDAIAYCHDVKNICHRDLKVENFLLLNDQDDAPVKIIDFGLSRFNHDNIMTSRVGTVYYVAPEVLSSSKYTNKCDIWSIGVIAYVLLCGFPPFHGNSEPQTLRLVKEAKVKFPSPIWDDVSQDAREFIMYLLNRDPDKRPTAREALEHPWLSHRKVQPKGLSYFASFLPNDVTLSQRSNDSTRSNYSEASEEPRAVDLKSTKQAMFQRFLVMIKVRKHAAQPTMGTLSEDNAWLARIVVGVYTFLAWSILHVASLSNCHLYFTWSSVPTSPSSPRDEPPPPSSPTCTAEEEAPSEEVELTIPEIA
eukprot:Nitzschia sp. Nitz4//scaffold104_size75438//14107//15694//NITZ4_005652-RA/size75438-snap-gene-0.119-mRNA-1//-1//CDS//3329532374//663//frame0